MKVPKIFVPEKNLEKNLEKILSKKFYMLNKERNKVMMYSLNGELLGSTMIGQCMDSLEMFTFHNKKMLTAKFGDSNTQDNNRAIFDERLNHLILTTSYPNQAYCVFERKNGRDLLMLNTAAQRTKGTKITYYDLDGTKLDDFYYELHDVLTNKAFVIRTNEQNYLALCFNHHTLLIHEDLHTMLKLKTVRDVNDVHIVNLKGDERVIALCFKDDGPSYQVLRIFDNKLKLLEELNTKDFKNVLPTDDPWHDQLLSFKTHRFGSQDYFFATIERKSQSNRTDLKVLNTDFKEVFQSEDIVKDYVRIEKFNSKDYFFILANRRGTTMIEVYDEMFELKDTIAIPSSGLLRKYEILNFNNTDYLAYVKNGCLNLYSGDFPHNQIFCNIEGPNKSIPIFDTNNGLEKIIPFNHKGNDFLALEYGHGDGIYIYDENLNLVKEFSGRDLCVA